MIPAKSVEMLQYNFGKGVMGHFSKILRGTLRKDITEQISQRYCSSFRRNIAKQFWNKVVTNKLYITWQYYILDYYALSCIDQFLISCDSRFTISCFVT